MAKPSLSATAVDQIVPRKPTRRPRKKAAAAVAGRGACAFPIVGIGCSAGGLEALEHFLSNVPAASEMAFVIVQHLDPTHASSLPQLLQRATAMVVVEAADGLKVGVNHVYVIPPNKDLALAGGRLQLIDPTARRGLRLPVDVFLRSLAEERQEKAIGVILSGMGSDGLLGMRAIKEKAGLTLVQEPASAKADSMPRSVIDAGLADIVALAAELPARIADYLGRSASGPLPEAAAATVIVSSLEQIVVLLRERTGNDFSLYKTSTLYRRIERRAALHKLSGIASYATYLAGNKQEIDLLFKELLIGVTRFFRDAEVWEFLVTSAIPALLARYPGGKVFRAWVAGCSSGEEAYSLAIVFKEALEHVNPAARFALQIYATDLDADAIDKARKGVYPANIVADVSAQRLARYFTADETHYRIHKEIREMVIFAPQNVVSDPPFTKLDFVCCRNLLIYFGAELQKRLFPIFHYALNPGGILCLGSAETIGGFTNLFSPLDNRTRIFERSASSLPVAAVTFPAIASEAPHAERNRPERLEGVEIATDQLIQQNYAPAGVLVNGEGDILYISGRTGKYLEPAAGKVNVNIHAMAREGLREALTGVIRKASLQNEPIHLNHLHVGSDGETQTVNVTVTGLSKPESLRGRVLVLFSDVADERPGRKKLKIASTQSALAHELQSTREALQVTHEEMQTSVEELKSTNEELQSTNEELQSTNEEMTTSKEEMQSLNEELQTVNAELQSKVDELTLTKNDMANLLDSTEIATVFLDDEMKLRRFTTHATRLFKLIPGDVGRPLSDIVSKLDYPALKSDARKVLQTLVFCEKQIGTKDGKSFRVRIMPYRTQENLIDGIVITFVDITEVKKLEDKLKKKASPTELQ